MPMAEGVDDASTRTLGSQQWEMREAMCTRFVKYRNSNVQFRPPVALETPVNRSPDIPDLEI